MKQETRRFDVWAPLFPTEPKGRLGCVALAFLVGSAAAVKHPTLLQDSSTYENGSVIRTPVVPLIFQCLHAVMSAGGSERCFEFLQGALAALSCLYLSAELARRFDLRRAYAWATVALLSIPQWQAATSIGSESIAYSLLCVAFATFIPLLWQEIRPGVAWRIPLATALLLLTRPQFVFLVPVVVAVFLYVLKSLRSNRARVQAIAGGSLVALLAVGLQAAYMYPRIGRLGGAPFTGAIMLTMTTSLATGEDVDAIPDPAARSFAREVWTEANELHELANQGDQVPPNLYSAIKYNDILGRIVRVFMRDRGIDQSHASDAVLASAWVDMNDVAMRAVRPLARRELRRLVALELGTVLLWERYMVFLVGAVLLLGLLSNLRRSATARLMATVSVGWFANVLFVAALEPPMVRYTFYFDELVVTVLFCFLAQSMNRQTLEDAGA